MRLKGKKAIVTGSSRGVGAAVALAYGREGADVVVNYTSSEGPAQEVVSQIKAMGQNAVAVKADAGQAEGCQALVEAATGQLGGLDIVVNNAGFTRPAMLHKMTEEQWDAVLGIHLKAVWLMSKYAHPVFKEQGSGRIINVTSVAGVVGTVGQVNYSAAKGGVISLTKSIAREMARSNVCANVVSLGIVATDMTEKIRSDEKLKEIYMNRILLKRFAEADDVTPMFVFLASDEASYVTGQLICVDGGYGMILAVNRGPVPGKAPRSPKEEESKVAGIPDKINTWQMTEQGKGGKPGVLQRTTIPVPELAADQALVQVAGCGVCHTDLGYFYDGVPMVNQPPVTLGHEISGTVVAGPEGLVGKTVIVPAVMPCGQCDICKAGRGNRCLAQRMPGNSLEHFGGFSDYIPVPAGDLCVIEELKLPLSHYAVVADACTTPYQAAMRAQLAEGDLVMVTGAAGGVGVYMTQIAKALGAKVVVGFDVAEAKLQRSLNYGADYVINVKDKDIKAIKGEFKAICKEAGVPNNRFWKIFECSGVTPGQDLALNMLGFVGKLIVVGFSPKPNTYMISRLMAFDAEMIGTWGCLPQYYPPVLKMVQEGKVQIEPFLETKPMSTIQEVFEQQHAGLFDKRQVLEPDF